MPVEDTADSPTVDDPDDYTNTRRLKDIFDARQTVREDRREAKAHYHDDNLRHRRSTAAYRASLEGYIQEVQPLLLQTERGKQHWESETFGSVDFTMELQTDTNPAGRDDHEVYHPGEEEWLSVKGELPDAVRYRFDGLQSLLTAPDPLEHSYEVTVGTGLGGSRTVQVPVVTQPNWILLDEMYLTVNTYLSSIGVELETTTGTDEWEV